MVWQMEAVRGYLDKLAVAKVVTLRVLFPNNYLQYLYCKFHHYEDVVREKHKQVHIYFGKLRPILSPFSHDWKG